MMNIDNTLSFYLLLACNGILAAAASVAILRFQKIMRNQKAYWNSPTGMAALAQTDNDALLDEFERRFSGLLDGAGKNSADEKPDATSHKVIPFENAVRMARHGATLDDLSRTCGLSETEARLLMRVHSNSHQTAASS